MSDPLSVQAAALAAVDRLIDGARSALAWMPKRGGDEQTARDMSRAIDGLEGRRRILQRHAPEWRRIRTPTQLFDEVMCKGCIGRLWDECEDWRDAAAGLPLEGADHD